MINERLFVVTPKFLPISNGFQSVHRDLTPQHVIKLDGTYNGKNIHTATLLINASQEDTIQRYQVAGETIVFPDHSALYLPIPDTATECLIDSRHCSSVVFTLFSEPRNYGLIPYRYITI